MTFYSSSSKPDQPQKLPTASTPKEPTPPSSLTPQETDPAVPPTAAISKAQRKLDALRAQVDDTNRKKAEVERQLAEARAKISTHGDGNRNHDPQAIVQRHITLLHRYNEIKDVGLGLLALIAERRGVRLKDVCDEFGVGEAD